MLMNKSGGNMKTYAKVLFAASVLVLELPASSSLAQDIDIYTGGGSAQNPNILFVIDNSANWNSNSQGWPSGKQGQGELSALSSLVGQLSSNVNVGLMMGTAGTGSNENGG